MFADNAPVSAARPGLVKRPQAGPIAVHHTCPQAAASARRSVASPRKCGRLSAGLPWILRSASFRSHRLLKCSPASGCLYERPHQNSTEPARFLKINRANGYCNGSGRMLARRFVMICFLMAVFAIGFSMIVEKSSSTGIPQHGFILKSCPRSPSGLCPSDRP